MLALTVADSGTLAPTTVPTPEASPGRVVVRVAGCGICGSDLHMLERGLFPPGAVIGHEAAGVVSDVGDGVDGFSVGDTVAIYPIDACGVCIPCEDGNTARCEEALARTMGLGMRPGAFAEHVEVSPSMLDTLPSSLRTDLGALAEPLGVALHGFGRSAFLPGMDVGVIGCGPIGLCTVLAARALGAGSVWACDPNAFRAHLAADLGADAVGPRPGEADLVVECAGATGTLDLAVGATRPQGEVVLLAANLDADTVHPFTWVTKEVAVVPALASDRSDHARAVELLTSGDCDVSALVTRRVSLDEGPAAFAALASGADEGKVLVTP